LNKNLLQAALRFQENLGVFSFEIPEKFSGAFRNLLGFFRSFKDFSGVLRIFQEFQN
jgi:hypothetical protein